MRKLLLKFLNWLQETLYSWELALQQQELIESAISFDVTNVDPGILAEMDKQDEQWLDLGVQQMYQKYNELQEDN